ncbi:MAG: metallophosphoesterase [Sulfuricella sp.]|nr:metallophosphoesterase [Sulfuricella sp.]
MTEQGKPLIRIAIVSDIHAFSSREKGTDSVLDFSGISPGASNPLSDLAQEIEKQSSKVDILVCAGDICNQADFGGLERAWIELHHVRTLLQADQMVATCGNHDLDSRYLSNETDPDPKGALLSLSPRFPFEDSALSDKFWARNYAVLRHNDVVIASLNTSAYHGGKQEEILYGRVSKRTIDALAAELKNTQDALAHVLVCHHHPLPLSGVARTADKEYIRNGQDLLDEIVKATGNSWLIIHGHRHKPRLIHGASSTNAVPFILGAGSLGARIPGVPNQFHIASLYKSNLSEHASIVGTVETWSWNDSSGWSLSSQPAGLPPICGFGYRGQTRVLASQIADIVGPAFATWIDVRAKIPSVDFLFPDALRELETELEKLGLQVLRDRNGQPHQVGR